MKKILIIDDDAEFRSYLAQIMKNVAYHHDVAASCKEALEKTIADDYDVVLLDMIMPMGSGVDCLAELKKNNPRSKIIVITGFASIRNAVDAIKKGASDFLAKPFNIEELLMMIRRLLEEAAFEKIEHHQDVHSILSSLASPIRSRIIVYLHVIKKASLREIAAELVMEDRAKVLFHLKKLQESGIVERDKDNIYSLTIVGERSQEALKMMENHIYSN